MTKPVIIAVCVCVVSVLAAVAFYKAYEAGRQHEREATLKRSIELLKERDRVNAEVDRMDTRALCIELGGVFANGECH